MIRTILPALVALISIVSTALAQETPVAREPPVALNTQNIPESLPIAEVTGARLSADEARQTVLALIRGLELPIKANLNELRLGESKSGTYRAQTDAHHFEVYPESGGIKYQNVGLYALEPRKPGDNAPPDTTLHKWADRDLNRLTAAKLIVLDQLDRKNVHIAHQRTRDAHRDTKGTRLGKLSTLDSRLDFTRRLGNLRVAGNGVRLIYGNDGQLYGCEIVWRRVEMTREVQPLAIDRKQALADFSEAVEEHRRLGSTVDVLQAELVYVDPDPRETVRRLEPTYLFLYRVRSPVPDKKGEFIVGKKQFYRVMALKPT